MPLSAITINILAVTTITATARPRVADILQMPPEADIYTIAWGGKVSARIKNIFDRNSTSFGGRLDECQVLS